MRIKSPQKQGKIQMHPNATTSGPWIFETRVREPAKNQPAVTKRTHFLNTFSNAKIYQSTNIVHAISEQVCVG